MTLVEVVVAIALLALVIAGAVTATGAGLQAWLAAREATSLDRRRSNWTDQLQAAVTEMIPMVARSDSARPLGRVFFDGGPRRVRFVTSYAPSRRGRSGIRLVEIECGRRDGQITLVLRDVPCPGTRALGAILSAPLDASLAFRGVGAMQDPFDRAFPRVIAERLSDCGFHYLESPARLGEPSRWVSSWHEPEAIPTAVRIEWVERSSDPAPFRASITAAVGSEVGISPDVSAQPRAGGTDQ